MYVGLLVYVCYADELTHVCVLCVDTLTYVCVLRGCVDSCTVCGLTHVCVFCE